MHATPLGVYNKPVRMRAPHWGTTADASPASRRLARRRLAASRSRAGQKNGSRRNRRVLLR